MQRYIGDRNFYRRVFAILMPILIQNVITNFVSMLDNIMVGQVGTEPMSGVAIVNQLIFVFNLCALGGVSGAGILTAQFYGKGDQEGIRQSVRVKLLIGLSILAVFGAVRPRVSTPVAILSTASISFAVASLVSLALGRIPKPGRWICG